MREKRSKSRVSVEISPTLDSKKDQHVRIDESPTTCSKKSTSEMVPLLSQKLDRPTPLDFDGFVPWVCLEWQLPVNVVVTRTIQGDYIKPEFKGGSSSCSKSTKSLKLKEEKSNLTTKSTAPSKVSGSTECVDRSGPVVAVTAHYDTRGELVEISIINCREIPRKVIQAISICMSFHSFLTKLTIRKGGVKALLLNEISKLLPHSNLTDICLDDCIVPQGNYDVILTSLQLKSFSLNRCSINDTMCKDIAAKIVFGSSLLVLELGSNLICDNGAKAIGESLRENRSLLHLNLSGNMITDDGAFAILLHFMEFPLTRNEIFESKRRKILYIQNKEAVYERFHQEALKRQSAEIVAGSSLTRSIKSKKFKKPNKMSSAILEMKSVAEMAETMTLDIVGIFSDPFDDDNVVKRECLYSKGNFVLCSLNFAYNNLTFMSIKLINDVLIYQENVVKPPGATGLIRVVYNGNCVPDFCMEYERIEMNLKKVVKENTHNPGLSCASKKLSFSLPTSRK